MSFKRVSEYYDILEKLSAPEYVEVRKLLDDFPNRSQINPAFITLIMICIRQASLNYVNNR